MNGAPSLKRNFLINLVSPVSRIAVAFATVPLFIHHIGNARYGVLSIVWVLLGYAGFLDLGMSRAAVNALSKLRNAPQAERARVLVTTLTVNFVFGLTAAVVGYLFANVIFSHFMKVPEDLMPEIRQALPWIAGMIPVSFLMGAGIGALESKERFGLANLLTVLGMSLTQILPVIVAIWVGPSLAYVIPAAAFASYFTLLIVLFIIFRSEGPFHWASFSITRARGLLSYGGWIAATNMLGVSLWTLDQFMIGGIVGVAAVAYYAVASRLVQQSTVFSNALARTLFPRLSLVSASEAVELAARAFIALAYGYGAIIATAIVATPVFFHFWLGESFAVVSSPLAQIMFVGILFNSFVVVPFHLLQGQGRPDLPGKMNMVEFLPFFACLWLATTHYGLTGAAAVWVLRNVFEASVLLWLSKIPRSSILASLPAIGLCLVALVVAREVGPNPALAIPAAAAVGAISVGIALLQSEDLRRMAVGMTGRVAFLRGLRDPA